MELVEHLGPIRVEAEYEGEAKDDESGERIFARKPFWSLGVVILSCYSVSG